MVMPVATAMPGSASVPWYSITTVERDVIRLPQSTVQIRFHITPSHSAFPRPNSTGQGSARLPLAL